MKINFRSFFSFYFLIIIASLIPLILFGIFTYEGEKKSHEDDAIQNIISVNKSKKATVLEHLKNVKFEIGELKNTISFLQQQAEKNIQNIQQLQKENILSYYTSTEKTLLSLAKKDTFQYIYSFLNRGKKVDTRYLNDIYTYKNELEIKNLFMINKDGKIVYSSDEKELIGLQVQTLTKEFQKSWNYIKSLKYNSKKSICFIEFGYDKYIKRYREFVIAHFKDVDGFIAYEINQEPIQKMISDVSSLGNSAETYLIYKSNNKTYLASDRIVKKGYIGGYKSNSFIDKGFYENGVSIKYGSLGDIELVGFMPIKYKNLTRSMQTTVKYIDIISPKINGEDYFQKFVKDYNYHNLMLISSKGNIIYSIKHEKDYHQNILQEPFKGTILSNTVKEVLDSKKFLLSDVAKYDGCNQEVAQFAISPILNSKSGVEILVSLQLKEDSLTKVLEKNDNRYYKSLDSYVIGLDYKLRSDTQLNIEGFDVLKSFSGNFNINKENVDKFLNQNQTLFYAKDYRGVDTISTYSLIEFSNIKWILVTKIDAQEISNMILSVKREIIIFISIFSLLAIIIMFLVGYYKKQQDEKLLYSATHDSLTKLPNRRFVFNFLDYLLANSRRKGIKGAVLFMDLDNFKSINDSFGHEVGDFVLVEVSARLKTLLRENDILSRLGGDEFLVVVDHFKSVNELDALCNRIINIISKPIKDTKRTYQVGVSIGISVFPDDSEDAKELLQFADTAMYKTKAKGKNNFTYYSKEMTQNSLNIARVENQLKYAIENDELVLHYQPQIDINTQQIVGVEALVRWEHPKDGLIPPNDFIPIAENSDLIVELGRWVTKKACIDFKSWKDAGYEIEYIAVNMSAKQLSCGRCSNYIRSLVYDLDFDPKWLELEITENTLIENFDKVIQNIDMFRDMGIKFSIDDFGTGYSSLSYLKLLKISTLKIDREFIKDILTDKDDLSIVKAVISMGHALNYKIIAEGAEYKGEVDLLRELKCDVIQGYYYSKPLKEVDLLKFMDESKQRGGGKVDVK